MTKLLAQHGYGKGAKITDSLNKNNLNGAIFSPNDEDIDKIIEYANSENNLNKDNTFIDPQFFYSTFDKSLLKKLSEIEEFPSDLQRRDWRKRNQNILGYLDYHADKTAAVSNTLITPGFYIKGIDWKFDYSVDIYNYCVEKYDFNNYAMSLLIDFTLFNNLDNVKELIDELSDVVDDKDFIYFTISYDKGQNSNYDDVDPDCLGNMLYFIYSLKKEGYKFIVGYTFMDSVLFGALGCEYVASGWFNSLRKFQNDRFEDLDTFGLRKKRYTSLPLLSNIMYDDIETMLNTGEISEEDFLSNTEFDESFPLNESGVSLVDLEHQFWESISKELYDLSSVESLKDRLTLLEDKIEDAITIYRPVLEHLNNSASSNFQNRIRVVANHLPKWLAAIDIFKTQALIF